MAEPQQKPHALFIPYPAQSHIKATMKFAKLLHHRGFHITFVNNEFNHKRFLKAKGPNALDGLPDFRFTTIPDGLPPSSLDSTQDVPACCNQIRKFMATPFRALLTKLQSQSDENPPISCVIADLMPFAIDVAAEFGIPSITYWSFAACGFMGFRQFRPLREKGITPFKDDSFWTDGTLETAIEVPGMKDIRLKNLPSFFKTTHPEEPVFHTMMEFAEASGRATAIVIHTFDALEPNVLGALNSIYPNKIYTVGPMQLLLDKIPGNPALDAISYSLWKEEPECLRWLDTKPANSVIYVNFGSITTMSKQHLIEFAMGIANSDVTFLWVIRPDLVTGESAALPPEFQEKVDRNGFICGWCPQEEVLNHPAVGGFLTHCGWGSIIESLTAGVPLLCWTFFGDQPINCRFACTEWGIGMEIDQDVKRAGVEELVRELITGEKGEEMRNKAGEWGKLALEATGPAGSSTVNLDRLVSEVLLPK